MANHFERVGRKASGLNLQILEYGSEVTERTAFSGVARFQKPGGAVMQRKKLFLIGIVTSFLFLFTTPLHALQEASFSWLPNPETNLSGYKIHYGTTSAQYDHSVDMGNPTPINGLIVGTVSGLVDSTTYYFVATAYDTDSFESAFSQEVVWTAPSDPVAPPTEYSIHSDPGSTDMQPPSSPVLTVSAAGLDVTLSWGAVSGATGYTLYYAPYPYLGEQTINSANMGTATSFSATLWDGASYYVAITAGNESGESGYSNIELFTLDPVAPPPLPIANAISLTLNEDTAGISQLKGQSIVTNKFFPVAVVGTTWELTKSSNGDLRKRVEVVSRSTLQGIECFEVSYTDEDGILEGTLYVAEDIYGAIRVIGAHEQGGDTMTLPLELAGTIITSSPQIDEYYATFGTISPDEENREVVGLDQTVTTPLGTYTGCVKQRMTGWGNPDWVDYVWYCPDVGWAKWEENNVRTGWQEISYLTEYSIHSDPGSTDMQPPSSPVLTVSAAGLDVTLSWGAVSGATGYTLYYAPYPYLGEQTINSANMGTATSFSATLWDGASYYVAITAGNESGESGYSNIELFTLDPLAPPIEQCNSNNLNFCETADDCFSTGGFWYDNVCNSTPAPFN